MNAKVLITLFISVLINLSLFAENNDSTSTVGNSNAKSFSRLSVGVSLGSLVPYTDVNQHQFAHTWKKYNDAKGEHQFGIGLLGNYAISNVFTLRGQFLYGKLAGTWNRFIDNRNRLWSSKEYAKDNGVKDENIKHFRNSKYFETNLMEMSLHLVVNLSNVAFKSMEKTKWGVYVYAGHGLVFYDAKSYDMGTGLDKGARKDGSKFDYTKHNAGISNKTNEAVSTFGGGVKYKVSSKLDLALEPSIRRVWNDNLDGWKKGKADDFYGYTALMVTYKLGKSGQEALEWVNPLQSMYEDMEKINQTVSSMSRDTDGDGVADFFDKDSNTPSGVKVYGDGTSADADADGVPDSKDMEPSTPKGCTVDANGIANDSDGDGVADCLDKESNTPRGSLVDVHGKEIKISVAKSSGSLTGSGAIYFPPVFFMTAKSDISSANYDKFATIARELKSNPDIKVSIVGHADKTGKRDANMKLGMKRAEAVKDHLVKNYGISADRISIESRGQDEPLSLNDKMLQVNRRVDVKIKE